MRSHAQIHMNTSAPKAPSFMPLRTSLLQRKCACGGSAGMTGACEGCGKKRMMGIQTKLAVSEPGDKYEQEADRVAEQVLRTPDLNNGRREGDAPSGSLVQRRGSESAPGLTEAPTIVNEALRSPSQPLDAATRAYFEPRFGHDFSRVRVHSGGAAAQSARAVNAVAYTVGHDIVFGAGQFTPGTHEGRRLIAHELAHVAQQSGSGPALFRQSEEKTTSTLDIPRQVERGQIGREEATPSEETIPMSAGSGPECSRSKKSGKELPFSMSFDGEVGFAYIPSDGHPGPGGVLVDGNAVTIKISARWVEQIEKPDQRPPGQGDRRPDSPQYYLSFNGWIDECGETGAAGRQASSVQSGNLAIGKDHTVNLKNLRPGRYGLQVNPSTSSPEKNRVLKGNCEIKAG
jgi:Domain of unknown function (DUF4157)